MTTVAKSHIAIDETNVNPVTERMKSSNLMLYATVKDKQMGCYGLKRNLNINLSQEPTKQSLTFAIRKIEILIDAHRNRCLNNSVLKTNTPCMYDPRRASIHQSSS